MPNKTLPQKIKEMGFCCPFAYFQLQQSPKHLTMPRFGATSMAIKADCARRTIYNWRGRFREGQLACEGQAKCLKGIWEGKPKGESVIHVSYRWPSYVLYTGLDEGKPTYIARFRDLPLLEVIVPGSRADIDTALSEGISDYIAHLIKGDQPIPKASRIARGERYVTVTPLMGPKLNDYLRYQAKKAQQVPIG